MRGKGRFSIAVAAALLIGSPAVGLLMAELGLIRPPELVQRQLPHVAADDLQAGRPSTTRESWQVLEDHTKVLNMARAVVKAAERELSLPADEWNYRVMVAGTGAFTRSTIVFASEKSERCVSGAGACRAASERLSLRILIEERTERGFAGSVAVTQGSSHTRTRHWMFTAAADSSGWVAAVVDAGK